MLVRALNTPTLHRYATGASITGSDALIHDFYASECTNPVCAACRVPVHAVLIFVD